ncbi:choice-of-anchor D domain-containing protein [Akkermansiaceae bacterium]|nr:choice-of-anchor D domain-containing protein [Akkermansiaceae bacterium]
MIKNSKYIYSLAAGLMFSSGYAAEAIIFEENFEDEETTFLPGNATLTEGNIVDDPEVGGTRGKVFEISLNGSNRWGGLTDSNSYSLTEQGIAGGADYTYSADLYISSSTALADNDRAALILRFFDESQNFGNRLEYNNFPLYGTVGNMPKDQWFNITVSGTVPTADKGGSDVTQIQPLLTVDDTDAEPNKDPRDPVSDGTNFVSTVFFDNVKFVATLPDEDPSLEANPDTKFGTLDQGETVTGTYTIKNLGATNDLVISSASLSGTEADSFAVTTTFPLRIPAKSEATIEVTFDSSQEVGTYSAMLELATNDVSDPTYTLNLTSIIYVPSGTDLILNGDFEAGSTFGFSSGATFVTIEGTPEIPAQSGSYYASYTLPAGSRWGSFQLDQAAPPAVEGASNEIQITPEMIGHPYVFRCWYYFPETGGINDEDRVAMILRWNGDTYSDVGPWGHLEPSIAGRGQWVEFIEEGIVPEMAVQDANRGEVPGQEDSVTSARLIFSMQDFHDPSLVDPVDPLKNTTDTLVYVDNMSFIVDVPFVAPPIYPVITVFARENADGSSTITWTSEEGSTYRFEFSEDLENWIELEEEFPAEAESETTSYTDTSSSEADARYYRVIWNEAPVAEVDPAQ